MSELKEVNHKIQKNVLSTLTYQKFARFRDMRPPKVDTNLYSYHLKLLIKNGFIEKTDEGYTLTSLGASYIDLNTQDMQQPTLLIMFVIQNSNGDVLLWRRDKQPYIDTWTLPYGKLHIDDESIQAAAIREANKKLGLINSTPEHAGDCYIRVLTKEAKMLSSTLVHVFRFEHDGIAESDRIKWARPHKLSQHNLAPAVEQIITRTFFRDPYFFEEYTLDW